MSHMCNFVCVRYPWRLEEGVQSSKVSYICEVQCGCEKVNSSPSGSSSENTY